MAAPRHLAELYPVNKVQPAFNTSVNDIGKGHDGLPMVSLPLPHLHSASPPNYIAPPAPPTENSSAATSAGATAARGSLGPCAARRRGGSSGARRIGGTTATATAGRARLARTSRAPSAARSCARNAQPSGSWRLEETVSLVQ
jgi:hypothetical protein